MAGFRPWHPPCSPRSQDRNPLLGGTGHEEAEGDGEAGDEGSRGAEEWLGEGRLVLVPLQCGQRHYQEHRRGDYDRGAQGVNVQPTLRGTAMKKQTKKPARVVRDLPAHNDKDVKGGSSIGSSIGGAIGSVVKSVGSVATS